MLAGVLIAITEAAALTAIALSVAWIITRKIVRAEFEDTSCDDTYLLRVLGGEGRSAIGGGGGKPYAPQPSGTLNNSHDIAHRDRSVTR